MTLRLEDLTPGQQHALGRLRKEHGATGWIADRDEPHDGHVFLELFADAPRLGEVVVEADGEVLS